ncbi:MAG: hypothetical protein OXF74_01100 [Rhodobacteraceae bacterium]|nr:hypothetical protein [Paracoccaceae bacterium]
MAHLSIDRDEPVFRRLLTGRICRVVANSAGLVFFATLVIGLILWGSSYSRSGGFLPPVIKASATAWVMDFEEQEEADGKDKELAIYQLVLGEAAPPLAGEISLAPSADGFGSAEISRREYLAGRLTLLPQNTLEPALTPPGPDLKTGNAAVSTVEEITAGKVSGTVIVELGEFSSRIEANNAGRALARTMSIPSTQQRWSVVGAAIGGKKQFRLNVMGFENWDAAAEFCGIVRNWESACSPVRRR